MVKKRKRNFDEMQQLRREYEKALKEYKHKEFELILKDDMKGLDELGEKPEKPSEYEILPEQK